MEGYQHGNPMSTTSDDELNDTFSFSSSFESMVLQKQVKEQEQEQEQDSDFEFNCITPESPTSDPDKGSPADHLFFNGRLQPHAFPSPSFKDNRINYSRCTSLTRSISSKNSFASSRSNSTNSSNSRSSCSSARTSSSEYRDKKPMYNSDGNDTKTTIKRPPNFTAKPGKFQPYASTQRWQFISPAPILTPTAELPRRKSNEAAVQQETRLNKQVEKTGENSSLIIRLFRSLISSCRECHALEPSEKHVGSRGKY